MQQGGWGLGTRLHAHTMWFPLEGYFNISWAGAEGRGDWWGVECHFAPLCMYYVCSLVCVLNPIIWSQAVWVNCLFRKLSASWWEVPWYAHFYMYVYIVYSKSTYVYINYLRVSNVVNLKAFKNFFSTNLLGVTNWAVPVFAKLFQQSFKKTQLIHTNIRLTKSKRYTVCVSHLYVMVIVYICA